MSTMPYMMLFSLLMPMRDAAASYATRVEREAMRSAHAATAR